MNTSPVSPIHKSLIDKLLDCITYSSSPEKILALTEDFKQRDDLQEDKAVSQSMAILNFLAHQIQNGNADLVSPKMIEESCSYILNKLLPYDRIIPYRIEKSMKHNK